SPGWHVAPISRPPVSFTKAHAVFHSLQPSLQLRLVPGITKAPTMDRFAMSALCVVLLALVGQQSSAQTTDTMTPAPTTPDILSDMTGATPWALAVMIIAAQGALLCIIIGFYFCYRLDNSFKSRESAHCLGYIMLFGCFLMYGLAYAYVIHPHEIVCGVRRAGMGFIHALVFAPMLLKAIRIWRVSRRDLDELTPMSGNRAQLLFTVLLLLPEIVAVVQWLWLVPPSAKIVYPSGEPATTACGTTNQDLIMSLIYVMFLMFLTLLFSFLACPSDLNMSESRFIFVGIVFSIGCLVAWICCLKMTDFPEDPVIAIGLLCMATIVVVIIFLPKVCLLCRLSDDEDMEELPMSYMPNGYSGGSMDREQRSYTPHQYDY
ncbi:PREDICTED: G-protein coupled receptor family C group 5 member B-like, partial [Branchiostoma belcheri]|uniref:G-protein coupled receptor family C group 5 member B-like n=1 Tax=Branchiostoma belcheri TaxID=7741 RepID=A0A6P4ZNN7_BRABE